MIIRNRKGFSKVAIICLSYASILLQTQAMDEWEKERRVCQNQSLIEMQAERKSNLKKAENAWRQEKGEIIPDEPPSLSLDTENSYHFNEGLRERSRFD